MARKFKMGSRSEVNKKFDAMEKLFAEMKDKNSSGAMAADPADRRQEGEPPVAVNSRGE